MHTRSLGLTIALLTVLCPAVSNAWPWKKSLDACVGAFEKTLADPGASSPAFKVVYASDRFSSPTAQYFPSMYTYDLQANDPRSGVVFARARCSADQRGIVSSLSTLPLHANPGTAQGSAED